MQTIQVRIFALSAVLCAAGPAISQMSSGQEAAVVKGEIENSQPNLDGYTIQLYNLDRHSTLTASAIRPDGEFEFRRMPYGSYLVTVTSPHGDPVYQGSVIVGSTGEPIIIRLPNEEINRPISGTISVKQLQHPPTRKAIDAARTAQKFSEGGDYSQAVEALQKAISLSPDYADAWMNLGAQHLHLGAYGQSIEETRHAMELAGPSAPALDNLAAAFTLSGRDGEARDAAEQALHLKPDDPHANYILGVILYRLDANDAEAVRHLRVAAPTVAGARAALAKIH